MGCSQDLKRACMFFLEDGVYPKIDEPWVEEGLGWVVEGWGGWRG